MGETGQDSQVLKGREGSRCVPGLAFLGGLQPPIDSTGGGVLQGGGSGCLVWGAWGRARRVCGRALTMEGPEVVVPQVHQVLQGRVKLLQDALDPEGQGTEGGDRRRNEW